MVHLNFGIFLFPENAEASCQWQPQALAVRHALAPCPRNTGSFRAFDYPVGQALLFSNEEMEAWRGCLVCQVAEP